ncbi:N-methyl-L-tryptophan oxidase [Luteolibacter soli]|uniref:N-methyl-L-tryptophan oxidase n=1 Tax=Luteolibacter soli TaxID=3135280 RepID=A0ABU9AQ90_9BACT
MRIAIVGLGAAGSAALLEAARAGFEVVGFEQFEIGHELGSSHGASRLIRRTYPDAFHSRWMGPAYEAWARVEALMGEELFVKCGGLTFGPEDDATLRATCDALVDCGIAHKVLSREGVAERFPAVDIGKGAVGIYQADSGFLRADRCVRSQVEAAKKLGAVVHERCEVIEIVEKNGGVTVVTDHGSERFDAVVVTAGPWVGRLLPGLRLPLRVMLRQTIYLGVDDEGGFTPGEFPVWIHHPTDHYGFPSDGVLPGIKVAWHHGGPEFDPSLPDRPVMEEFSDSVRDHARKHVAGLTGEVVSAKACLYTVTPDERFILDFVPGSRRQIVCSGCSGHGFKFSALLGELAVVMARDGRVPANAEPWSLARFR